MAEGDRVGALSDCTVGALADCDARVPPLFARLGLPLRDGGLRTLAEACEAHGVSEEAAIDELTALGVTADQASASASSVHRWALDDLCELLVGRDHAYLRAATQALRGEIAELLGPGPGDAPSAVRQVAAAFDALVETLLGHVAKEEAILFPALAALAAAYRAGTARPALPFPTVLYPVRVMETEHERLYQAVERLERLVAEVGGDAPPAWQRCGDDLVAFAGELRRHIDFENGVLFPRALDLERRVL